MKKLILILAAAMAMVWVASASARHDFASWGKGNIAVYSNAAGTVMEPYVQRAIENWELSGVNLDVRPTTDCSRRNGAIVLCVFNAWPGGGSSTTYRLHGNKLAYALVRVNAYLYENPLYEGGANPYYQGYEWDGTNYIVAGTWLPCHELGHALGLGHDNVHPSDPAYTEHQGCVNDYVRYPVPSPHDYTTLAGALTAGSRK